MHLGQQELAERIGLSQSGVGTLETAVRGVDLDTIPRIANALDLSPQMLLETYLRERQPIAAAVLFSWPGADYDRNELTLDGQVVTDPFVSTLDRLPHDVRAAIEHLLTVCQHRFADPSTDDRDGS